MQESGNLEERVNKALENIRPYLLTDGGDVSLIEITENMVVKIELQGSCVTCPMSSMTLKAGVEQAVMSTVPEIKQVIAVNVVAEG